MSDNDGMGTGGGGITWLSQAEWVLARPDTFIGPVAQTEMPMRVYRDAKLESATITVSPALLRLAGELISNAVDNSRRGETQRRIDVVVDRESGRITVSNDGSALPVRKYEGTERYEPSIAFSEFQAGTNFNDNEERLTIGRNGVGSKGANVFARRFEVAIVNAEDKRSFEQTWEANMTVAHPPNVAYSARKTSSTVVRWDPDYARLDSPDGLSADAADAVGALAVHASLCVPRRVTVTLNGAKVGMRDVKQYAQALGGVGPFAVDTVEDARGAPTLSLCVAACQEGGEGCVEAFVNSASCCDGTHVRWLVDKVRDVALERVQKRAKDKDATVRPAALRGEMVMVAVLLVPNPEFTSQLKTCLNTKVGKFGFAYESSDAFRSAIERSPLIDRLALACRSEADRALRKSTKAPRGSAAPVVAKYEPAMRAGKRGAETALILTEGDSAKALAVAGLSVIGRELHGVFPLRGKLINTRNAPAKKVVINAEIAAIMKIVGLEWGKEYDEESVQRLRYHRILGMTDQDVDGTHIMALVCNFIAASFPSVLRVRPDFVWRFVTPVVRVTLPGGAREEFHSEVEYARWRDERVRAGAPTGTSKYYKGLGSSTPADAREYFRNIEKNQTALVHEGEASDRALALHFDEGCAAERRAHMETAYDPGAFVDYATDRVSYQTFLDDELSHFSMYACRRQIPSVVDGLVPARRKVLHTVLRKNVTRDVKVAQLMATVAEFTSYHHGEASLGQTIVNMARDHVFSNNVALLQPKGMFGSRHARHDDAAPRYICTHLDPITLALFPPADAPILEYAHDDGIAIEPVHFVPVIPMVLVNGCHGIGTGWSTFVPPHCPNAVIARCRRFLAPLADPLADPSPSDTVVSSSSSPPCHGTPLAPWYAGFRGTVHATDDTERTFIVSGVYEVRGAEVHVLELPPGRVTEDYVEFVRDKRYIRGGDESNGRFVQSDYNMSTDARVHIVLVSTEARLAELRAELPTLLRLEERVSTTNMSLFDASGRPRRFDANEIVEHHGRERLRAYERRLAHQVKTLQEQLAVARNRARFIDLVGEGAVRPHEFADDDKAAACALCAHDLEPLPDYKYLLDMRIGSLTKARAAQLRDDVRRIDDELTVVLLTTPVAAWTRELDTLEGELAKYRARKEAAAQEDAEVPTKKRAAKPAAGGGGKQKKTKA